MDEGMYQEASETAGVVAHHAVLLQQVTGDAIEPNLL